VHAGDYGRMKELRCAGTVTLGHDGGMSALGSES
jgi:hypothetical protein